MHLLQQRLESDAMDAKAELARVSIVRSTGDPEYFFMAADFVSSYTGDTPFFHFQGRHSKDDHGKSKIETRMCGVRVICGDIDEFWIFYTDNFMPGGANVMVEIMRQAVAHLVIRLAAKGFKLPRKCFLYFDNCAENKNRIFQAWASLCVEMHYMDEMEASYLVTGHTHNNVDQTLGSYSTIRDKQAFISTPVALKHLLQNHKGKGDEPEQFIVISLTSLVLVEYDPPVIFEKIELIWDWASLTPLMNKKIKHFQVPHVTKFKRFALTGKCHMQYKIFSDRKWMPPAGQEGTHQSQSAPLHSTPGPCGRAFFCARGANVWDGFKLLVLQSCTHGA
jgi:hypothetical protein